MIRAKLAAAWDKVCRAIAWRLPKRMVMWCAIRVIAYATQGKWSSENVGDVSAMSAVERWEI